VRNKYLSYDDQRAPKVREMFSRLAERYDLVNDVMSLGLHRRWKAQTVRLAWDGARRPARWLDLCCGTGDMALLAANIPGVAVTGADFTLPMLAVARRRARRSALPNLVQAEFWPRAVGRSFSTSESRTTTLRERSTRDSCTR